MTSEELTPALPIARDGGDGASLAEIISNPGGLPDRAQRIRGIVTVLTGATGTGPAQLRYRGY